MPSKRCQIVDHVCLICFSGGIFSIFRGMTIVDPFANKTLTLRICETKL
jgi:hypothetical protein